MKKLVYLLTPAFISFAVGTAVADESRTKKELEELKARVAELEAKKVEAVPAAAAPATSDEPSFLSGVVFSGFVDGTYGYSFNRPDSGNNTARVFDHDANSFMLNAVELAAQKAVSKDAPVGFRVDIDAGNDAELTHSAGLGDSSDSFDLQQGYVEVNAPLSSHIAGVNDLNLKFGKFVTLAGAEVIEAKDNWNTSRSFMFGYAIPFAHTGARATYTFDNTWDVIVGVNNGWDVFDDTNSAKTIETHVGFNNLAMPMDSTLTVALQGYFGPELAGDNGSQRSVADLVATYKTPWKPLTLIYNFDYGDQEKALEDGSSAQWYGHAAYAKYELSDEWALAGRAEVFKDDDGFRVVSGTPATYREFTATLEYKPWKNFISRLEFRNDHADSNVFEKHDGKTSSSQNTIGGEMIVFF